jgi:hypothetical protein
MTWFYLSFASETGFLGACVVEAEDALNAVQVATACGINPGGEAMILPTPGNVPGPDPTYTLLTREQLGDGATLGELADVGLYPPRDAALLSESNNVMFVRNMTKEEFRRRYPDTPLPEAPPDDHQS